MAVVGYDYPKDEKKDPNILSPTVIPAPASPKPAPKPVSKRKKASKWIIWQLWFNTYR